MQKIDKKNTLTIILNLYTFIAPLEIENTLLRNYRKTNRKKITKYQFMRILYVYTSGMANPNDLDGHYVNTLQPCRPHTGLPKKGSSASKKY